MAVHDYFLTLLIILLAARLFSELAVRLQSPPVIGELLAGVLLGSSLLGWVKSTEAVKLLAEIGIIMLLFDLFGRDRARTRQLFDDIDEQSR